VSQLSGICGSLDVALFFLWHDEVDKFQEEMEYVILQSDLLQRKILNQDIKESYFQIL
jgi:hypothetical protein